MVYQLRKQKSHQLFLTREFNQGIDLTGTGGLTKQKREQWNITDVATAVGSYHLRAGRRNTRKTSSLRMDCLAGAYNSGSQRRSPRELAFGYLRIG